MGSVLRIAFQTSGFGRQQEVQAAQASPCVPPIRVLHTEPYGSVFSIRLRCLVCRALGHYPPRRSETTRARRQEDEAAWIESYRQLWDARFDELDQVVEELKRKEKIDGRKKRE